MNYADILASVCPGTYWFIDGDHDDYENITWLDESAKPSKATLDAAWPEVRDALAWDAVRAERDRLLAASDWTRMDDAPLSDAERAAWAVYRQALRDVPQTFDDPNAVVWPEVP